MYPLERPNSSPSVAHPASIDRARPSRHDEGHDADDVHGAHDDFGGLERDLSSLLGRRRALQFLGGAGLVTLVAACSSGSGSGTATAVVDSATGSATAGASVAETSTAAAAAGDTATAAADTATAAADTATAASDTASAASPGAEIPDETQGPYPADGSNGPNLLADDGIVRSDLTTSIGDASGTAEGVPLTIQLTVVDAATGGAVAGAAVYLWHCTADGQYSIYEIADQNYLRGVQATDDAGRVAFTTVFPGCYAGRWPHAHFEVFSSLDQASAGSNAAKVSQLALPEADCSVVFADSRYGSSAGNLAQLSLDTDNVFADGWTDQLATVAGSIDAGFTASLLVRI